MLKLVLVALALCVSFASCNTLFFQPFGGAEAAKQAGPQGQQPNPMCPDKQGTCPQKSTCCPTTSGKYGCCPLPDAVCCSDLTHCCPSGFKCDPSTSTCTSGNLVIDWLHQITPARKPAPGSGLKQEPAASSRRGGKAKDVVCPDHSVECPTGNTCCQLGDKSYGCCPMSSAVCCGDHKHCCPKGYKCASGTCTNSQGQGSLAWMQLVLGKNKVSKSSKITSEKISPKAAVHSPRTASTSQGGKQRKKELPRKTSDMIDDDDDTDEVYSQHRGGKTLNVKGKIDGKNRKNMPKQDIMKTKPVSKKAKENINVKKDIPVVVKKGQVKNAGQKVKDSVVKKPVPQAASSVGKSAASRVKTKPSSFPKAPATTVSSNKQLPKVKSTQPVKTVHGGKVEIKLKAGGKAPVAASNKPVSKGKNTAVNIKKGQEDKFSIQNQMKELQAKGKAKLQLQQKQQQTKQVLNQKDKKPGKKIDKLPKGKAAVEKEVPKEEGRSVLNLDFMPSGVKKLIQKLGMMSANVKKVLVDSLLDNEASEEEEKKPSKKSGKVDVKNLKLKDNIKKVKVDQQKGAATKTKDSSKISSKAPLPKTPVKVTAQAKSPVPKTKPKGVQPPLKPVEGGGKAHAIKKDIKISPKTVIKQSVKQNVVSSKASIKDNVKKQPSVAKSQTGASKKQQSVKQVVKQDNLLKQKQQNVAKKGQQHPKPSVKTDSAKVKQQSAPFGQTKAPFPKKGQQAKTKPVPSRVVKPVAKDVPSQKTTQSVGIKTKVKSNVIEGIPSANLKALKQQLLQRQQQQAKQKQQQQKKPPQKQQPPPIVKPAKPAKVKPVASKQAVNVKPPVVKPAQHLANAPPKANIPSKPKVNVPKIKK